MKYLFKRNKIISALLIALMLLSFSGCGYKEVPEKDAEVVFTFAGDDVTLGEVYMYSNTVIEEYESLYGKDIWSTDVSVTKDDVADMEDVTRRDIIQDIVHVKMLVKKAPEYKVALSDDETKSITTETESFFKNLTDEQLSEMQLSYEVAEKVITENMIAKKVYDKIINSENIEVSDEEARETTFYDLYFECYAVASNGDVKEFSEDEKTAQYERAVQAYNTLINPIESGYNDGTSSTNSNSTNIEGLAEYYGLKNSAYYTMTPDEIKDIYGETIAESMYNLEDGSYSLVTESEFGYHIFFMKALTDREATDEHKQDIISLKRNNYMETLYSEWLTEMDSGFSYEKSVDFQTYMKVKF